MLILILCALLLLEFSLLTLRDQSEVLRREEREGEGDLDRDLDRDREGERMEGE